MHTIGKGYLLVLPEKTSVELEVKYDDVIEDEDVGSNCKDAQANDHNKGKSKAKSNRKKNRRKAKQNKKSRALLTIPRQRRSSEKIIL